MAPKKRGGKRAASGGGGGAKKRGKTAKAKDAEQEEKTTEDETKQSPPTEQKHAGDEEKQQEAAEELPATVERGHLFFFYRPKVDAQEVKGPNDIQKFYILMSPDGAVGRPAKEHEIEGKRGEERAPLDHKGKPLHRLLVVPGKCLPDPNSRRARIWSFVEAASSDLHEVEYHLERYSYDTKTRGHRDIQPARLIAEARYEIVQHSSKDSHLMYELEFPEEPTDVQKAFHIYKQGHFLVTVKNPAFDSPAYSERWAGFKGDAKANFSEELRANFQGKVKDQVRYAPLSTTDFLNVPHCELVLIGIGKPAKEEFREVMEELEKYVEHEGPKKERDVYKELDMSAKENPDASMKLI